MPPSSHTNAGTASSTPPARRELLFAALVAALLALAWLARPIARLGDAVFAPTDVVQGFALTRIDGAGSTVNGTQGDVAVQFLPWLAWQEDELRTGRIPLWDPYCGGGAPHLANGQSAVFSPFSAPFYVLDAPVALIVSAFLRLWLAAFAAYWLLRELACSGIASACGALAIAASGHQLLLLQYPHSAVAACALLALAFAARAGNATLRGERALGTWCGSALALVAAALAGHPEVLFFAAVLFVLVAAAFTARARAVGRGRSMAARFAGCAAFAAAGSAFQWLPFLEYLASSSTLAQRADAAGTPPAVLLARLVFPHLLGGPPPSVRLEHAPSLLDYPSTTVFHVGAIALALAFAALVWKRRDRSVHACAGLALVVFVLAQDVAGLGTAARALPLVGHVPWNRAQLLWIVALAFLAARGVDALAGLGPRERKFAFAGAVAFVVIATAGGVLQANALARAAGSAARGIDAIDAVHVARVALGLLAAAALFLGFVQRARTAAGVALFCVLADQTAVLHHAYVPLSDARTLRERSPAWRALADATKDGTLALLENDLVPPSLNLLDRVRQIASYDALWVRDHDALYQRCFGFTDNWRRIRGASEEELLLFGVDVFVARGDGPPLELTLDAVRGATELDGAARDETRAPKLGPELVDGAVFVQDFELPASGADRLEFAFAVPGADQDGSDANAKRATTALEGVLALRLEDEHGGELASSTIELAAARVTPRGLVRAALTPAQPATGPVRVVVSARGPRPGHAVAPVLEPPRTGWSARLGGVALDGVLRTSARAFPRRYTPLAIPAVERLGLRVWSSKDPLGRYRLLARARTAANAANARATATLPAFDPRSELVLEPAALDAATAAAKGTMKGAVNGTVHIERELPGHIELVAHAEHASWLRTTIPYFPGWRARVDGRATPIVRADGAFAALPLEPGEHTIELDYAPTSFRIGVALTAASALLTLLLVLRSRRRT